MSTSAAAVTIPASTLWVWPIDMNRYDLSPELSNDERLALAAILKGRLQGRYRRNQWRIRLGRLLDPMLDALEITGANQTDAGLVIKVVLRHMQRGRCSFWKWTEPEWARILQDTVAGFESKNAVSARSRPYLLAACVLLGRVRDLRQLGNFDRIGLAMKVFGPAMEASIKCVAETLTAWGYSSQLCRTRQRSTLCEIFLLNRSPLLEDISSELLVELHRTRVTEERRWTLQRISNALRALNVIETSIPHGFEKARGGQSRDVRTGVSEAWQAIAAKWLATSTLSERGRLELYYLIMKAGRWVTAIYPERSAPEL